MTRKEESEQGLLGFMAEDSGLSPRVGELLLRGDTTNNSASYALLVGFLASKKPVRVTGMVLGGRFLAICLDGNVVQVYSGERVDVRGSEERDNSVRGGLCKIKKELDNTKYSGLPMRVEGDGLYVGDFR